MIRRERVTMRLPNDASRKKASERADATRLLLNLLIVGAATLVSARIALVFRVSPYHIAPLWPSSAILVAVLLSVPVRSWPAYTLVWWISNIIVDVSIGEAPRAMLVFVLANTIEVFILALGVRRWAGGLQAFSNLRGLAAYILFAVLAPLITAFVGALDRSGGNYWFDWRVWFLGDVVAYLTLAPAVITWIASARRALKAVSLTRCIEAGLVGCGLLAISVFVFIKPTSGQHASLALLYLPLLALLWAAVRFGPTGLATSLLLVALLSIFGAVEGHGPFVTTMLVDNVLSLQLFLITISLPLMFLAVLIEERRKSTNVLRESEARINLAVNAANLGLWIWDIPGDERWVTEKWRQLFGFVDSEPVTLDRFLQVVHPGDRERVKQVVQHVLEHGGEYEIEYRITRPDGSKRWILGHGSVELDERGKPALARGVARDITKRKIAEEDLRESEARFRTMANTAPVMIWMSGPDKLCTFFNKPWLEFTGRTMEQEMGNGWTQGVHPDDLQRCLNTYTEAFDARQPFVMQYRLRRHDGEYRRISDDGVPLYDSQKNFAGYIGSCTDITELLKKEEVLHEFEERVALAAEAAHLGVWELDITTNRTWVSDKLREIFQFPAEGDVSYADFEKRVHPDDRAARGAVVKRAILTKGGYESEYRILLPDGTVRWIGGRARCLVDPDGESMRLLGVSMDVTEHKQAEEKFRMAVEASPSGILLVNQTGQIVLVNSQIEQLFGYRRAELIGHSVEILVPERFAGAHPEYRAKFFAAPAARAMGAGRELFARRKDGSEFPVEIGLNPIQSPEGMLILAAVVDISARKRAEEEAQTRREEINRLTRISFLGEMAGSIAHEVNQPLGAMMANASAMMHFIDRGHVDAEQLREILSSVVRDGRRARDVISNIRDTIKKGAAVRTNVALNDIVRNVIQMVQPDAAALSCELRASLAERLPTIDADPVQIQQVLINLVGNAFDAMRDISPGKRKVEIATELDDGSVRVSVRDHGVGIGEKSGERLFEQFYTTKEDGLGMGLAIVRSIIQAHSGTISAENAEGGGARFVFALPVSDRSLE